MNPQGSDQYGRSAAKQQAVSVDTLRELLEYDAARGMLLWKRRPVEYCANQRMCNVWNGRFAGKRAGNLGIGGYWEVSVLDRTFPAHRVVWALCTGSWPTFHIDHINGDRTDNRFENLRDVPSVVNNENQRRARINNNTGLLGAHLHKHSGLYHACIRVRGKKHSLGYHKTANDAHAIYVEAKRRLHEGCTL